MKISLNFVGDSNDKNDFPHKLLSSNTQFSKLGKSFANGSSINIKLLKTQLRKILGRLLGPWIALNRKFI